LSQPKRELTETQKKRIEAINEIVKGNQEGSKQNKEISDKLLKDLTEYVDHISDKILYDCKTEMQRAIVVEIIVETLLVRATLKGYIMAGLVEHIRQRMVTQPLASSRLLRGKQMIENSFSKLQQEKSDIPEGIIG
jgi:hypothetical protein